MANCADIVFNLDRIATSLEAIDDLSAKLTYNDKGIAQILAEQSPNINAMTLEEYFDNFETDDILSFPLAYALITVIRDILPTALTSKYIIQDPAQFTLDLLQMQADTIIGLAQTVVEAIGALTQGGELAADVTGEVVNGLDTIFSGISAGALSLSAITDVINLFRKTSNGGTGGEDPDNNPALRQLYRSISTIASNTELIGDNVDAVRVAVETQSAAAIVAQNTNFTDLIAGLGHLAARLSPSDASTLYAAISALELSCSPDVSFTCSPDVNVSVSGGNSGTTIEQTSGEQGGDPPAGTTDPSGAITDRKCKAANMIYDDLKAIIDQLAIQDVNILVSIGVVPSSDLLGQIITTTGGWVGAALTSVAGRVLQAAQWILTNLGLDLSNIATVMNARHSDLICALFNAETAGDAQADFLSVLVESPSGITTIESAFLQLLIPNDVTNVLFFGAGDSETILASYTATIGCGSCAGDAGIIEMQPGQGSVISGELIAPSVGYSECILEGTSTGAGSIPIAFQSAAEPREPFYVRGMEVITGQISTGNCDGTNASGTYVSGLTFGSNNLVTSMNLRGTATTGTVRVRVRFSLSVI